MAECRYKGQCRIEYDTDFDVCYPCVGDGNEACVSYEPMPDVKALLALADEMEFDGAGALDDEDWCKPLLVEYARRIREACGEVVG